MNITSSVLRHFDHVLEWSSIRKSRFILIIMTLILIQYWVFHWYQLAYPSPFINTELLIQTKWGLPLLVVATLLLIFFSYRLAEKKKIARIFSFVCMFYYAVVLIGLGYLIGLMNLAVGLVMAGAPILCFVLFRRLMTYLSIVVSFSLVMILSLLTAFNYLPYAPAFKPSFFYAVDARPFYLFCTTYFAFPHFISLLGACDLLLIRWRQREKNTHLMSLTDELTGLYNRRAIMEYLQENLSYSSLHQHPISIILLDLDFFKLINDRYGHPIGDKALQVVSLTLETMLRKKMDRVGRYGGEEFLVVLSGTSLEQAVMVAERCRVAISEAYLSDQQAHRVDLTASFGVSCSEQVGYDQHVLIQTADQYLYEAKHQGRNCVVANLNNISL